MNAPRVIAGLDFSDHLNYWDRDIAAVMITDTSFLRNDNYHTVKNTPARLRSNAGSHKRIGGDRVELLIKIADII